MLFENILYDRKSQPAPADRALVRLGRTVVALPNGRDLLGGNSLSRILYLKSQTFLPSL